LDATSGSTTPAATSTSSFANTELAIKYLLNISTITWNNTLPFCTRLFLIERMFKVNK
jgi:hypothetical protein